MGMLPRVSPKGEGDVKQIRNNKQIVPLIRDTCMALLGHANDNEVQLLLGTWAAENGAMHRKQIGGGPARGLFQMEVVTARDIFGNYLRYRYDRHMDLVDTFLEKEDVQFYTPPDTDLAFYLEHYDDFACAMARLHYLRDPEPIPDTLRGRAEYWKRIYNTPAGAGTVEHYLSQWDACKCTKLLQRG